MRKIERQYSTKVISCLLAFLVFFVSCSPNSTTDIANNENLQKMSGEDLFKSIIFKEGEFGKKLYSKEDLELLEKLDSQTLTELNKVKIEILNEIKKSNPNYFIEFKNQINSNDHSIVMKTIEEANIKVKNTASTIYNVKDSSFKTNKLNLKYEIEKTKLYNKQQCVAFVVVVIVLVLLMIPVAPDNNDTTIFLTI